MKISVFYDHALTASGQTGLSIQEVLKQVKSYGIEGVELDFDQASADPEAIRSTLQEAGLTVACVYGFFEFGEQPQTERAHRFIETAAFLGADKVLAIPGFIEESTGAEERSQALQRMSEGLRDMCRYASDRGITVTMEDFDDSRAPFSTSDELLWFLEQVPELGCTFDTGNFKYRGEDELSAYEKLKDRTVHVHCKDRSLDNPEAGAPKIAADGTPLYPSPMGSGCIPIAEIVGKLVKSGYDGVYAIEHFDASNQLLFMKRSADWLRSVLETPSV